MRPKVGEKYIHYKNPEKKYEIVFLAKDKETLIDVVAYRALYPVTDLGEGFEKDPIFVRPIENFCEVFPDGQSRFKKI